MPMQRAAVDTEVAGHAIGRTETGRQGPVDAYARIVAHRGIRLRRDGVEIPLDMVRHCRVRGRHWRIEVARETDDRVELLTKFDSRPEETAMRVFAGGGGVRETDRLRPPAAAEQLLQAFVNKAQPEFDALTDRHQASRIDGQADRHQIAVLSDRQTQPVAVQMHVLGEGF